MGSTTSIAKVEAINGQSVDPQQPPASPGTDVNNLGMTSQITTSKRGSFSPPPPPPPPPLPPQSNRSGDGSTEDEVDAPLFDQKMKEKVLGKDGAGQSESKSKPVEKTTIVAMNESDRKAMENMRKEHPNLSGIFDGFLAFVAALRNDPGLDIDSNFLRNCIERDLMNVFMEVEDSDRKTLGDFLAVIGAGKVLYDSYHKLMTKSKLTHLTDVLLYSIKDQSIMMFIVHLRGVMWNFCDSSLQLCERIGTTGMFDYLVQDLIHMKSCIDKRGRDLGYTFESCVGILHNTSKFPGNCTKLRAIDTSLHLLPFLKCTDTKVKMITLLTLSYLLDESQNHLLLADDSVFDFMVLIIKRAFKGKDHRYDGFSVQELVEGLTGLAKNDDNKKLLVKKGTVPMLMTVMEGTDDAEKKAAVSCMWELSFDKDNRKSFHDNENLMKLLKSLKDSDNKRVSKAASGALWEIHLEDVDQTAERHDRASPSQDGHIMISYQWADQKKLLQVKESLRESGYRVWMDVDNMGGSTLQAMAEAVQNAAVVLVCMSERYKQSQNCRSEAEYAFSLQKQIVPLVMEMNYKPDGWLGIIKGTKLFFEFSGKYPYEQKISDLIRELGNKGKGSSVIPVDESKIPVIRAGPVDAGKGPNITTWSSKDVHNWLNKSKVTMNSHLQKLTGEHLVFLRKLSHRAPEFYYGYIERKLHLETIDDMMHFSTALDSL